MTEYEVKSPIASPTKSQAKLARMALNSTNPPAHLKSLVKIGAVLKYGLCVGAASLAFAVSQTYQDKPNLALAEGGAAAAFLFLARRVAKNQANSVMLSSAIAFPILGENAAVDSRVSYSKSVLRSIVKAHEKNLAQAALKV